MSRIFLALAFATLTLAACSSTPDDDTDADGPSPSPSPTTDGNVTASYDFDGGSDGWASDITDYSDATRPVSQDDGSRLSVDKGGQSQGGEDAEVAGTIDSGIPCEEAQEQRQPYADVTLDHTLSDPVTTTEDGTMWLFVGTDSGFEGRTSLYYDRIEVTLTPATSSADDAS